MSALRELIACEGDWSGTNVLQDPEYGNEATSASTATVVPVMDGRFVRIDYRWSYRERPQWGSLLVGYRQDPGEATIHWVDSWHNGDGSMMCRGTLRAEGVVDVRGSYGAGSGPDWGWRIRIQPDPLALRWVMHNITPDGEELLAVEEALARP